MYREERWVKLRKRERRMVMRTQPIIGLGRNNDEQANDKGDQEARTTFSGILRITTMPQCIIDGRTSHEE